MRVIAVRQFEKTLHSRIGTQLKEERRRLGYSRQKVSTLTGIPVTMITQYEQNAVLPSDYRFDKLLLLYGISGEDFLRTIEIPNWDSVFGHKGEADVK